MPFRIQYRIETAACLCFTGFSLFPCGGVNDLDPCHSRGYSISLIGMKESLEDIHQGHDDTDRMSGRS